MLKFWWAKVMATSVTLFIKELKQDEKYSVPTSIGSTDYVNVWIRQHELTGSIGRVEPDPEEELPESYQQIRGVLLELISMDNDYLNEGLYHPSNAPLLSKAIGLRDFVIPGKDNRDKQLGEITELTKSGPINEEMSSVETDPIDDDLIHIQVIKAWAVSATGIAVKQINPEGYQNVMLHMLQHESVYMQKTEQSNTNPEGVEPDSATETTHS